MDRDSRKPAWKKNPTPKKTTVGPIEVKVFDNNVEQAMKVLDKKLAREGVMAELKRRRYAEKPSEAKRRKQREAEKKARRLLSKSRRPYRKPTDKKPTKKEEGDNVSKKDE
ncbi:MAG: 30S ribosomal protein S21 [bacterium]